MKDYIRIMCAVLVILILIPLVSYAGERIPVKQASAAEESTVNMLLSDSGEIKTLTLHDYITGAVFAQMPADFGDEALKAQAVLAATYISRRKLAESLSPTEELHGADLSDDHTLYNAYLSSTQAKELYGDRYEAAYKRISAAADYAENYILVYDGEPIAPAFHGISYGQTESAEDIWGEDIPYLVSVESSCDADLPVCSSEVRFSADELKEKLSECFGAYVTGDEENWIRVTSSTSGGTALTVNVCGVSVSGDEFCDKLGLLSANFVCSYSRGEFVFEVKGCGHLVGMSEFGANEMAKKGASSEEILKHYFKGTKLENIRN